MTSLLTLMMSPSLEEDLLLSRGLREVSEVSCETFCCCDGLVSLSVMLGPRGGGDAPTHGVYSVEESFTSKIHG